MIVDELVNLIRFDMPATSKTALAGVNKTISRITDQIKSLGIVSAVTSGIFAAFSVNAAKEATSLSNLSQSTGVAVKEIEALGAVYKELGGSAKDYASDAEAFRKNWGQELNLEKMVSLSKDFVGLTEKQAYQLGRAYGFSDSMIRALRKGPDELRKMGDEAAKYNATSEDSLKNLRELDTAWEKLKNVIGPVANEVQGAFAPILKGGLTWLADLLKENKDSIRETMTAISDSVQSAFKLIGGYAKEGWEFAKPYLVDGWSAIDGAANEAMKRLGPILEAGWNAATKIITDAWSVIKPEIEKGWDYIRASAQEASPKIEAITTAIGGYYQSLLTEIGKLNFKSALQSVLDYLTPSDGMVNTIKSSLGGISDSIAGFYDNIKKQVDDGALGRMWDTLKSIATSPLIQGLLDKLKKISEVLSGLTWTGLETAFKLIESLVEPTMKTIQGLLDVLDGVANFDMSKILKGISGIAEAFAKALSDVFEKIIPDLLSKILRKLPVVGDYFKEAEGATEGDGGEPSTLGKAIRIVSGANAIKAVSEWWDGDKSETPKVSEIPVRTLPPASDANPYGLQTRPTNGAYAPGTAMSNHLNNNTTNVTIYQMTPPSSSDQMYKAQGGLPFQRMAVQ